MNQGPELLATLGRQPSLSALPPEDHERLAALGAFATLPAGAAITDEGAAVSSTLLEPLGLQARTFARPARAGALGRAGRVAASSAISLLSDGLRRGDQWRLVASPGVDCDGRAHENARGAAVRDSRASRRS
jgi:hypothetical protein